MNFKPLFFESVSVGVIVVLVGTLISFIVSKFTKTDLPPVCKNWNKNYIMEITLFFVGVFTHLICEFTGLNKWYCKNGNACKK